MSGIPNDDPGRKLIHARPERDKNLPHIGLLAETLTVLLRGEDTNNQLCVIDMFVPPGGGPPPHRHDFEETFVVLEGEVQATFRGQKELVRTGETIHIPADAPHRFQNISDKPARLLCICSPAGQEEYFMQVGIPVESRTAAPPPLDEEAERKVKEKAKALASRYRTEFVQP